MFAIHVLTDGRRPGSGFRPFIDFEIQTAPGICDNNCYRYYRDDPKGKFTKLYGLGRDNFGKAARGKLRQRVSEYLPQLFDSSAPFILIPTP